MIPEAQHFDPLLSEELVSLFVLCPLVGEAVSTAIELDGEFRDGAVEIKVVSAAGVLPAEFEFVETPITQKPPEAFLGVGGVLTELGERIPGRRRCGCGVCRIVV